MNRVVFPYFRISAPHGDVEFSLNFLFSELFFLFLGVHHIN